MREVTIGLYQYDELSPEAQEHAREWFRRASDSDFSWSESVLEDADTIAEILGITIDRDRRGDNVPAIYWEGFGMQGSGACFTGTYRYAKGAAHKIRAHAPEDVRLHAIADDLQTVQKRYLYALTATITHAERESHEYSTSINVDSECGGIALRLNNDDAEAIRSALRAFMRWIYMQLETEYEYQTSEEQVASTIRANAYEFTEDGERA